MENLEVAEATKAPASVKPATPEVTEKPKRKPLPDHLERIETEITPGDECSECGGSLKTLGEDITVELEYVPPLAHASMRCRAAGSFRCE